MMDGCLFYMLQKKQSYEGFTIIALLLINYMIITGGSILLCTHHSTV